jgi:hypothetical protein
VKTRSAPFISKLPPEQAKVRAHRTFLYRAPLQQGVHIVGIVLALFGTGIDALLVHVEHCLVFGVVREQRRFEIFRCLGRHRSFPHVPVKLSQPPMFIVVWIWNSRRPSDAALAPEAAHLDAAARSIGSTSPRR